MGCQYQLPANSSILLSLLAHSFASTQALMKGQNALDEPADQSPQKVLAEPTGLNLQNMLAETADLPLKRCWRNLQI